MSSVTQSITMERKENGLLLHHLSKANIATNNKFLSRLYSLAWCPGLEYHASQPAGYARRRKEKYKNFSHHLLRETLLCVTIGQEREQRTKNLTERCYASNV